MKEKSKIKMTCEKFLFAFSEKMLNQCKLFLVKFAFKTLFNFFVRAKQKDILPLNTHP